MAYKKVRIFVRLMNNYMTKNVFLYWLHTWGRILGSGVHEELPVEQTKYNGAHHTPLCSKIIIKNIFIFFKDIFKLISVDLY